MNLWKDRIFKPLLISEIYEPFDNEDYLFEIKYDGIRCIAFVSPNSIYLMSRNNIDMTDTFKELETLKTLVKKNVIFDGEIIVLDNGVPSFSRVLSRVNKKSSSDNNEAIFVAFDILYEDKNLIDLPLIERKKILNRYSENDNFIKSKVVDARGVKLFESVKKLNLEGIVAKEKNSPYLINKRSDIWIKIKNQREEEFYVCGYEKKKNDIISLILGEKIDSKYYYVGNVTLARKDDLYNRVISSKVVNKTILSDYNKNAIFINPKITCKVRYLERTKDNHLRHPVIIK